MDDADFQSEQQSFDLDMVRFKLKRLETKLGWANAFESTHELRNVLQLLTELLSEPVFLEPESPEELGLVAELAEMMVAVQGLIRRSNEVHGPVEGIPGPDFELADIFGANIGPEFFQEKQLFQANWDLYAAIDELAVCSAELEVAVLEWKLPSNEMNEELARSTVERLDKRAMTHFMSILNHAQFGNKKGLSAARRFAQIRRRYASSLDHLLAPFGDEDGGGTAGVGARLSPRPSPKSGWAVAELSPWED